MAISYQDLKQRVQDGRSTVTKRKIFMDIYEDFRNGIADNFSILMDSRHISNQEVADAIGIGVGTVSSRGRGRFSGSNRQNAADSGGFQLTAYQTYLVCYNVFNMSMQEFVSNEITPVILPKRFNLVAETVEFCMSGDQRMKLCRDLQTLLPQPKTLDQDTFNKLPQNRIYEGCAEMYVSCDDYLCPTKHTGLFPIFFENNNVKKRSAPNTGVGTKKLSLRTFVFMSILSGIPIDYFCVEDYTKHLPILYDSSMHSTRRNGLKTVCKQQTRFIISNLLQMPEDLQSKTIADIVRQHWRVDKKAAG